MTGCPRSSRPCTCACCPPGDREQVRSGRATVGFGSHPQVSRPRRVSIPLTTAPVALSGNVRAGYEGKASLNRRDSAWTRRQFQRVLGWAAPKIATGRLGNLTRAERTAVMRVRSRPVDDRLLAALIHHDGGAVRVKCVLEECEVKRAPEQRAALVIT